MSAIADAGAVRGLEAAEERLLMVWEQYPKSREGASAMA